MFQHVDYLYIINIKVKEKTIGIVNGPDKKTEFNFDQKCENPEHELFMFCVLLERYELALVFWQAGNVYFLKLFDSSLFEKI